MDDPNKDKAASTNRLENAGPKESLITPERVTIDSLAIQYFAIQRVVQKDLGLAKEILEARDIGPEEEARVRAQIDSELSENNIDRQELFEAYSAAIASILL